LSLPGVEHLYRGGHAPSSRDTDPPPAVTYAEYNMKPENIWCQNV
jgi:hypothetical protein